MKALFKLMLKGSFMGAIAMATATGCGDDSSDPSGDGGEGNSGGSSAGTKNTGGSENEAGETGTNGGSTSEAGAPGSGGGGGGSGPEAGGAGAGGATTDGGAGTDPFAGGAPGAGGAAPTGPTVAKFCNTLYFTPEVGPQEPTTFRLEVGTGVDKVTFTADSGECVPADGDACTEIPVGAEVEVALFDVDDDAEPVDFATTTVLEAQRWVFYNEAPDGLPIWNAGTLKASFTCEDFTYTDLPADVQ